MRCAANGRKYNEKTSLGVVMMLLRSMTGPMQMKGRAQLKACY